MTGEELERLCSELASADVGRRREAAQRLATSGEDVCGASDLLISAMADDDEEVREWANSALESMGRPPAEQESRLRERLGDANPDCAYWAATLLGRLFPAAEGSVSALGQVAQSHPERFVRERAAWALKEIGTSARQALP